MAISNILKDIHVERNLIQEDLAEATGSCSRTIGRIEEIFKLDDGTSSLKKTED